jgi:crossover junction endodeoxyribonuclease RuvC
MATILGIDPGSRKTGFGVIRTEGKAAVYVTSGIIRLPVDQALGPRLGVLFSSLNSIIDEFNPDELAIEEVFLARKPRRRTEAWACPGSCDGGMCSQRHARL